MRTAAVLACVAGLCSAAAVVHGSGSAGWTTTKLRAVDSLRDGRVGTYSFKEWREARVDATRIAVKAPAGPALDAALAAAGLDPSRAEVPGVAGWRLVATPAGSTPASVETLVRTLAASAAVDFVSPVLRGAEDLPVWVTPGVMAGYADGVDQDARDAMSAMAGVVPSGSGRWESFPGMDLLAVDAKDGYTVLEAANALAAMPETTFAEPDLMITGREAFIPNDPLFGGQWALHNIGQAGGVPDMDMDGPEAWDQTFGTPNIIAVVMDMGIQAAHPDLNLAPGADFTGSGTNGEPLNQCDNHGVAVAGCISARINNGIGVTGIAPGCRSASAKIGVSQIPCNGFWNGQLSWSADALNWAQAIGARVTNNSNTYGGVSAAVEAAYAITWNAGLVHFAAAGNNGGGSISYPASIPVVNSVAALERTGNRAGFSQFGPGLDFSAPGASIDTTDRTGNDGYVAGDYVTVDGTSFASPYAAGVACLILSKNPSLSSAQVEQVMQLTCMDRGPGGYDIGYGWGFVNASAALALTPFPGPPNNGCGNAADVSAGGTFSGTLAGATNDGTANCGSSSASPDVWYRFTAPSGPVGGILRVSTCGTHDLPGQDLGIDTVLSLHNSCGGPAFTCDDDTSVCGASDAGTRRDSFVSAGLSPGQTVLIRVANFASGATGPFRLNVSYELANDACGNAIDVSAGGNYSGTLVGATNDGTAGCGLSASNPDVWYTYTQGSCPGRVTFSTCGSNAATGIDTVLAVLDACGGNALACNDDACGLDSIVAADLWAGQTVKLRVSKFGGRILAGFTLNVAASNASNDSCANAVAVTDGDYTVCNTAATTDGPTEAGCSFCCGDLLVNNDMWYRYTATSNADVTVDTTASPAGFDTKLAAYAGGCPSAPNTAIACNDDVGGPSGTLSSMTFHVSAGQSYLIRFGGFSTARGSALLRIRTVSACPADFNGDGFLDFFDYDDYVSCFETGSCPPGRTADFNGDGFADFFDYDDFVLAFENGC